MQGCVGRLTNKIDDIKRIALNDLEMLAGSLYPVAF